MEEISKQKIDLAIALLDKEFKTQNSVVLLGEEDLKPWPAISTGAMTLDLALGIGGLPKGRIVEIYGPESSGKSTIAMQVVAEAQSQGGLCAYIDAEHAVDPVYAQSLGVNIPNLYFSQPDFGEMALQTVDALTKTGAFSVIVVDSVAALIPKAELEGEMSDQQMGAQARMMAKAMRKLTAIASENNTMLIFINQLRQKIGVMFGSPETTPGGMALKYAASVRLDVRKIEQLKDKDGNFTGVRTRVKVIKNKMAPPLKQAEFDIVYGKGIDNIGCVLDLATERGITKKSGAWYSYNDQQLGQGKPNTIEALASDLDLFDEIKELVMNNGKI